MEIPESSLLPEGQVLTQMHKVLPASVIELENGEHYVVVQSTDSKNAVEFVRKYGITNQGFDVSKLAHEIILVDALGRLLIVPKFQYSRSVRVVWTPFDQAMDYLKNTQRGHAWGEPYVGPSDNDTQSREW